MIAFPPGVKVWIAGGVTDMRCGMNSLALKVQQGLGRDPQAWFADILARMPNILVSRRPELLPWNWSVAGSGRQMAARWCARRMSTRSATSLC